MGNANILSCSKINNVQSTQGLDQNTQLTKKDVEKFEELLA